MFSVFIINLLLLKRQGRNNLTLICGHLYKCPKYDLSTLQNRLDLKATQPKCSEKQRRINYSKEKPQTMIKISKPNSKKTVVFKEKVRRKMSNLL